MLASTKTSCAVLLLFFGALVLVACSTFQMAVQETMAARIELTENDLFGSASWTSTQVSVLGFHLGMTWADALTKAREQKLQLKDTKEPADVRMCTGKGLCEVFNSAGSTIGLTVTFGESQEVTELLVQKISPGVPAYDEKNQVSLRFRGETFKLFHQYSNERRLKLLGPEASSSEDRLLTTFGYPGLGVYLECYPWDLAALVFSAPTEKR